MKFGFYVSNKGTRLIKILNYYKKSQSKLLNYIDLVIIDNTENIELKKLCTELNIDFKEIDLSNITKSHLNKYISNQILNLLQERDISYLFLFCNKLLKGKILNVYKHKIVNFHPSLLPSYKGFSAIDQALKNNAFLLGNTAHFIDHRIDSGPIIMQSLVHFYNYKCYDDILDLQIIMVTQIIFWLLANRVEINEDRVTIKNAKYSIELFVPNLEFIDNTEIYSLLNKINSK